MGLRFPGEGVPLAERAFCRATFVLRGILSCIAQRAVSASDGAFAAERWLLDAVRHRTLRCVGALVSWFGSEFSRRVSLRVHCPNLPGCLDSSYFVGRGCWSETMSMRRTEIGQVMFKFVRYPAS